MKEADALEVLGEMFGGGAWPEAVRLLHGAWLVEGGDDLSDAAKRIGTSTSRLKKVVSSKAPFRAALGVGMSDVDESAVKKATGILGQMLLGRCAELAFENLYRHEMEAEELQLINTADAGSDTDYRLHNGQGRKLYRINIKFHGSQFRRAKELVGLEPEDCFALATYKIKSALEKQDAEGKPYFFAIVGVPHLTTLVAGKRFPPQLIEVAAAVLTSKAPKKRKFEDAIIDVAVSNKLPCFLETYAEIERAAWYILSARRASEVLKQRMFERVYALAIRNFTRAFSGAEVDMHFSLTGDLTPLPDFFKLLKKEGREAVATRLERGDL